MAVEQLIVADRAPGAGVDPEADGYQAAACSPGLSKGDRDRVVAACTACGRAAFHQAPEAAHDRLREWRQSAEAGATPPAETLALFPVVWSYDDLGGRFALSRVAHVPDRFGRDGCFFAHALVFEPAVLAPFGSNPMTARHSPQFRASDDVTGTELPALPDLGPPPEQGPDLAALARDPWAERLPGLLTALARGRLTLTVPDADGAPLLLEALLALLPALARCRTTFRTLTAAEDTGQALHAAVRIGADPPPALPAGAFGELAAGCVRTGKLELFRRWQELLRRLEADRDPALWDALAPAAALFDEAAGAEATLAGARCLAAAAAPRPGRRGGFLARLLK